jgi:D-cysteine desulfhydrase
VAAGHRPYIIPYGGSNAVGAWGYAVALAELLEQLEATGRVAGHLVIATSSGGTQAGLVVGARALGYTSLIHGISIDQRAEAFRPQLAALARATARQAGLGMDFTADDFIVHDSYLGAGYGIVGDPEREAIGLAARSEGLLVDPVYTGRALAGLVDLIQRGVVGGDEAVVFWHTGGLPAIFAYGDALEADASHSLG